MLIDNEGQEVDVSSLLIATPDAQAEGSAEADAGNGNDTTVTDDEGELDAGNPEGTDSEGADEPEGEEPDGEEDASGADTEPKYTVKRDGKEYQVTLKEALDGYQRQDDYTRKTQEISTAKQALDADTAAVRTSREQYANVLKVLQERIGPADQEPTQEQWNALQTDDPDRYAVEWANYQRRKEQREAITREQDRVSQETRADNIKQAQAFVDDQRVKLFEKMPEWKEPAKYEAGLKVNREYAVKTLGFTEPEVNAAYDHRFVVAIDKARRYDALMAKQAAAKQKLAAAPEIAAPGARRQPTSRRQTERAAAEKQLDRTGKAEDAAALMFK